MKNSRVSLSCSPTKWREGSRNIDLPLLPTAALTYAVSASTRLLYYLTASHILHQGFKAKWCVLLIHFFHLVTA